MDPKNVQASPDVAGTSKELTADLSVDESDSKMFNLLLEDPPTFQMYREQIWTHTRMSARRFERDGMKEELIADPVTLRLFFGLPAKVFEVLSDFSIPSFQVNFDSSRVLKTQGIDLPSYKHQFTYSAALKDMERIELTVSNCCGTQNNGGFPKSFEFIFPRPRVGLPAFPIILNQCDHIELKIFDTETFKHVTSLTLSEQFLKTNEGWTTEMLKYFQHSPGNLRELLLPVPIYCSTDLVTAVTGFLRHKAPHVTLKLSKILKVGDEAFPAMSASHLAAVQEMLAAGGNQKVFVRRVDGGGAEESRLSFAKFWEGRINGT